MLKRLGTIVALGLVFLTPPTAGASFVSNYSKWKGMGDEGQQWYAMALFDSTQMLADRENSLAVATGMDNCGQELDLTPGLIAEAITKYYESNVDKWGMPPAAAFYSGVVNGVCFEHFNAARVKLGLEPLPKN